MLISAGVWFGMVKYSESDTEYYGQYVKEIRYYEDWNEYIHRTCYRTHKVGKTTVSVPYDCSYVQYHPEEYKQLLSDGCEYSISKKEYLRLKGIWNTETVFVNMNRHYFTNDGDMYKNKYDGVKMHVKTVSFQHSYDNKVKASYSIFGFKNIDKKEATTKQLFEYPKLYSNNDGAGWGSGTDEQNPILGHKTSNETLKRWQFINAYYGPRNQFRTYVLVFKNKPLSIVKDQQSYWQGGNKNEMILCIGIDSTNNNIKWVDAFSWCDKPTFEVNFKEFMRNQKTLNLDSVSNWVEIGIHNGYWKRKNFKDFDYISVELSNTQLVWLFIIIMLFNIVMSIYVIVNETEYNG